MPARIRSSEWAVAPSSKRSDLGLGKSGQSTGAFRYRILGDFHGKNYPLNWGRMGGAKNDLR